MLHYFQSAYLSRNIVILIMAAVCWLPTFLLQPAADGSTDGLIIIPGIPGGLLTIATLAAFLILLLSGLVINHIATDTGITARVSTLALFVFILFSVSLPSFTRINLFLLINLLLVFFLRLVYMIPETKQPVFLAYNAALFASLASLLFQPVIFFVFLLWIGLVIHRNAHWRAYAGSLAGLVTPYFFVFLWYYWFDRLEDYTGIFRSLLYIDTAFLFSLEPLSYMILAIIMVLIIIAVFRASAGLIEKNINLRRNMMITLYFLLFATAIALLFGKHEAGLLLACVPASLLVAHLLQESRATRVFNTILTVLIAAILINHYLQFLI